MQGREDLTEESCPFCRIATGQASATMLYEDKAISSFLDNQPATLGHTLVVPRIHAKSIVELGSNVAGQLLVIGRHVLRALRASGLRCEGVTLALADGEAAGQTIGHVHLHVVPRYVGDGFVVKSRKLDVPADQMESTARKIRSGIRASSANV